MVSGESLVSVSSVKIISDASSSSDPRDDRNRGVEEEGKRASTYNRYVFGVTDEFLSFPDRNLSSIVILCYLVTRLSPVATVSWVVRLSPVAKV